MVHRVFDAWFKYPCHVQINDKLGTTCSSRRRDRDCVSTTYPPGKALFHRLDRGCLCAENKNRGARHQRLVAWSCLAHAPSSARWTALRRTLRPTTTHTTRAFASHPPHVYRPWQEPWDPSSFNFYKASPLEFVLSYTPSFRHERNEAAASAAKAAGVIPVETDTAAGVAAAAVAGEAKAGTLGALRGAGNKIDLGVPAGAGSDRDCPLGCAEASTVAPPQDAVLVNIRPVGLVSLLLTPGCVRSEERRQHKPLFFVRVLRGRERLLKGNGGAFMFCGAVARSPTVASADAGLLGVALCRRRRGPLVLLVSLFCVGLNLLVIIVV